MSSSAGVHGAIAPLLDSGTSLGGGRVVAMRSKVCRVALKDGREVEAQMALAFSYVPAVGDELLIVGNEETHFVIGVLHGAGQTHLEFPGDVTLRAGQNMHLEADEGISLTSSKLEIGAATVRIVADTMVESAREVMHRVRDLWSVRAGEKSEQVVGEWSHRSERASITTADDVDVNGREIRLG